MAKHDRVFLATLNFPPGTKEDRERRYAELVLELCRTYPGIDRQHLIFVGLEAGATAVIRFVALYPRVFSVGLAIDPRSLPNLEEVRPSSRLRLIEGSTRLHVTYDPKNATVREQLTDVRRTLFRRSRVPAKVYKAAPAGLGKPSEEEAEIAQQVIREAYSTAKRTEVAMRLRDAAAAKREAEKPPPETKEEGKEEPGKEPAPEESADDVLVAAQEAYEKREYAQALELYKKLAKLRPDSEYSRLAEQRIKELESDPTVRRAVADAAAERRCRPWLNLARNFRQAGEADRAVELYKRIIAEFPDSSFAEEARRELKTLEEKP